MSPLAGDQGPIRVLSLPAAHRYVEHLADPDGRDQVVRLPDPPVPGAPAGVWWPSPALEPGWVREHADAFDLVHLHFGFESRTPEQLSDLVATLRRLGRPLVLTVHDLTNPHLRDQSVHLAQLDVLVPGADAVLTLTAGAAERIRQRWGVEAGVVPHPHMAPLEQVGAPRPPRRGPRLVGVHLKNLRANLNAVPVVDALAGACAELAAADGPAGACAGVELVVHVHREVRDPAFARHDPEVVARLDALAASGAARVRWVERMSDAELTAYLRRLDVSVLPYRWGTHSGWLEECRDLGTAVLAPRIGHFAEQGPVAGYPVREGSRRGAVDVPVEGMLAGLRQALEHPPPAETGARRRQQRREIARRHHEVYADALAGVRMSPR